MTGFADTDLTSLALDDLLSLAGDGSVAVEPAPVGRRPVAIIGLAARIAGCPDLASFWELLRDGQTSRRALPPDRRADLMEYLRLKGALHGRRAPEVLRGSFLSDVDKFDHRFFGLARQEANMMDPHQRLFLETAWAALEHAGHAGEDIKGSSTGVFVGFSADFGDDYRDIVRTLAPDAPEVAVVGNVKSLIASRIAYHLDLHGPSMMIDTACSSGLVALHQACRAIMAGDCDLAIAGAVKVDLVPVADDPDTGVGIKDIQDTAAHDGRTRTFDDDGAGTAGAEGVLAFVLKDLGLALADGDTIHAVVLGSSINQDGRSVGITAPNMAAQEALIVRALESAQVHPETISCIEAHGTATKLGDPIEVAGISRAWNRYTRRRQFCPIGSVKSNLGHLDGAAGLAGLAKLVLAMAHAQIPASLHFRRPNRKIAFDQSPLYVNDILSPWLAPPGVPRRAGLNSFGLSGTNCHVILEQPPALPRPPVEVPGPHLLLLSAQSDEALMRLLSAWRDHLKTGASRLVDLCYTAALGRLHHNHRLAIRCHNLDELRGHIELLVTAGLEPGSESVAFDHFRRVGGRRGQTGEFGEVNAQDKKQLDHQARDLSERVPRSTGPDRAELLLQAARLYVQGAAFDWRRWFDVSACRRVPLPTYPFSRVRCWVGVSDAGERLASRSATKQIHHPLLDRLAVESQDLRLFETQLGVASHWELHDHKVQGHYILPGTAFIEMILAAWTHLNGNQLLPLRMEQLLFLRPCSLDDGQLRSVQVVVQGALAECRVRILSRPDGDAWELHAEARLGSVAGAAVPARDLVALQAGLPEALVYTHDEDVSRGLEIGDRWNLSVRAAWTNGERDELLVRLALPEAYLAEADHYHCHPALLDTAVNAANHLAGGGALYLPFSYKRLEVFQVLPVSFYSHLRRKRGNSSEAYNFDIELLADDGSVCVRASDYTVKRVAIGGLDGDGRDALFHVVRLVPTEATPRSAPPSGTLLLLRRDDVDGRQLAQHLAQPGVVVIELVRGPLAPSWHDALAPLAGRNLAGVVNALGWSGAEHPLDPQPTSVLDELLDFLAALAHWRLRIGGNLLLLTRGAFAVEDHACGESPRGAALAALARIVRLENPQLRWRCVDCDQLPEGDGLLAELAAEGDLAVWRRGECYQERLETLPPMASTHFTPNRKGVYLITGGSGALGLELAALLAARGPVNLALVASKPLPPQDEWEEMLVTGHGSDKDRQRIARLLALMEAGAHIECLSTDVADAERMTRLLADLRAHHGRINGVIHAAGRAGEGFLHSKPRAAFARVVAPKIDGARLLHTLTLGDPLDFFILYSSVATVLRSAGQGDYTAGNAYLDALARYRRSLGLPALSVCWPAWREVGIAVEYGAVDELEFFAPIAPAQALPLIEQILCDDGCLPPVLVAGEINERATPDSLDALGLALPDGLRTRLRRTAARRATAQSPRQETEVTVHGMADPDELTRVVAGLWGRILGLTEVHGDDAFADQGGNSILTTQLYREYEARYPGALDVVDLFTHTTVREQVALLRRMAGRVEDTPAAPAEPPQDDLDSLLARLAEGSITADEAASFLSN